MFRNERVQVSVIWEREKKKNNKDEREEIKDKDTQGKVDERKEETFRGLFLAILSHLISALALSWRWMIGLGWAGRSCMARTDGRTDILYQVKEWEL